MPRIETVEQLAEFLEQNDEWRRKLFAILVPRSLQRMPAELDEFREETRAEFRAVRQEMREGFERVDREFENVRQEMREGFERVDREMREGFERVDREFEKVRQEMREGFERVDREFEKVRQEMREGFERVDREMREGFERQGAQIKKNTDDIAELKGLSLEAKFRDQARSWFSKYLKKARVADLMDVEELLPEEQPLTEQEREELSNTDLFLLGTDKRSGRECVYIVEVSWVVDANDVERAVHRAQILTQRGLSAAAVAAGRERTEGAREAAQQLGCGLFAEGRFEIEPSVA